MKKMFDSKFNIDVIQIGLGQFYISNSGEILTTTLGSCVSTCLYDPLLKIGGLNHFMLPKNEEKIKISKAYFGDYSIEKLISGLLGPGSLKENLKAKIFGGANMLSDKQFNFMVGEKNVSFAKRYLEDEQIPILASDIGPLGQARKIYFDSATGFVKLFRIEDPGSILEEEIKHFKKIRL